MPQQFLITQRHYDLIIGQCQKNWPQEAGGFVGGADGYIKAVMPLFNIHMENKTDTFALTQEDIYRAHDFFKKHNYQYFGVYHSHPKGAAYPSDTDINTGHRFHFIISLTNRDKPVFNCFEIINRKPIYIPLVVSNESVKTVDLHAKKDDVPPPKSLHDDAEELSEKIEGIKTGGVKYQKLEKRHPFEGSDFSTFA